MLRKILLLAAVAPVFAMPSRAAETIDLSRIPNGFASSKVGDWVKYRTLMGDQIMTLTSIENEGEDMVVKVKTDFYSGENLVSSNEDRMPLRSFFNAGDAPWAGEGVEISDEVADFNGKTIKIVAIRNPESNILLQMSEEIPLVGILKLEVEGEPAPIMELVDFGRE
ncbi:MAG: hypothetical protein LBJ46_10305 [Planctomycetota bacterium]|jgi:hypothetical protein|nr:hypothetical protein [Planctomycetota bacterium]